MKSFFEGVHAAFHRPTSRPYRIVQPLIWTLILLSIASLLAESFLPAEPRIVFALRVVDRTFLGLFAVEYLLRVLSFRPVVFSVFAAGPLLRLRANVFSRIRFALRPMMLVDLLAVLALIPELRGLRVLRLLRLLRTVKLFRYSNPFTSIFHAFEANSLLFVFGFTLLGVETVLGGVSMFLVETSVNPQVGTIGDGLWWALVTLTTVGFGDITPMTSLGRIIGGAVMIAGMFTLALFAGFVGSSLLHAMLRIREEQFRMGDYVNHVVICGYDDSTETLLDLIGDEFDLERTRVVVFENNERPREVASHILWVEGDPTKQSELDKVRLTHAAAVLVIGKRAMSPQAADARSILITFTVRAYLQENAAVLSGRHSPLYVATEILDSENVAHARTAGADEVLETRRVGFSMLAHSVRYHGTAEAMSRLLTSGSYNAYVGQIPEQLAGEKTYDEVLAHMALKKRGGVVIGVRLPTGEPIFNPAGSLTVKDGCQLIYLAERPILDPP